MPGFSLNHPSFLVFVISFPPSPLLVSKSSIFVSFIAFLVLCLLLKTWSFPRLCFPSHSLLKINILHVFTHTLMKSTLLSTSFLFHELQNLSSCHGYCHQIFIGTSCNMFKLYSSFLLPPHLLYVLSQYMALPVTQGQNITLLSLRGLYQML